MEHALQTLKQSLYRYQHDGVDRFLVRGRLLLADDIGLGKTAQAIEACHALWHTGRVRRGLLAVPAALKLHWLREWQLFTDAHAAVVDGTPGQRRAAFEACRRGFLLGNYDELASIVEWVDDLALEPKWRLAAWHTTPVDGKTEIGIGGARNLDTLRTRFATCMIRRVRHEVLSQLPARTDTRIPIEMTAERMSTMRSTCRSRRSSAV